MLSNYLCGVVKSLKIHGQVSKSDGEDEFNLLRAIKSNVSQYICVRVISS